MLEFIRWAGFAVVVAYMLRWWCICERQAQPRPRAEVIDIESRRVRAKLHAIARW